MPSSLESPSSETGEKGHYNRKDENPLCPLASCGKIHNMKSNPLLAAGFWPRFHLSPLTHLEQIQDFHTAGSRAKNQKPDPRASKSQHSSQKKKQWAPLNSNLLQISSWFLWIVQLTNCTVRFVHGAGRKCFLSFAEKICAQLHWVFKEVNWHFTTTTASGFAKNLLGFFKILGAQTRRSSCVWKNGPHYMYVCVCAS